MTKRALACFTLTFVASLALLPRLLPRGVVTQPMKLPYFAANQDGYDVVFLGTSEIYFHVIPAVFDEELARAGQSCRSFNFGLGGMTGSEGLFYWRAIRDLHPARLQYLFVDVDLMPSSFDENQLTRRVVAAHTSAVTWITVQELYAAGYPAGPRLALLGRVGRAWLDNVLDLGIAGDFLQGETPLEFGVGEAGYIPALRRLKPPFDFDWPAYQARIQEVRAHGLGGARDAAARFSGALVARIAGEARAAGVTPFLVRGPRLDVKSLDATAPWFDFSDVNRYPDLHTLDARIDEVHLNDTGARRLSVHLAQEFLHWLEREGRGCAVR